MKLQGIHNLFKRINIFFILFRIYNKKNKKNK